MIRIILKVLLYDKFSFFIADLYNINTCIPELYTANIIPKQ